jgi:hypothetical protein
MNRIAQLGDEILRLQEQLGIFNGDNLNPGLTTEEFSKCQLFQDLPPDCDLRELYAWRNGSKRGVAMGKLWIVPGHYFITAQDAVLSNHYMADKIPDWKRTWFPILSSGSSDFHFIDKARTDGRRTAVFYSDPEFSPGLWQIYDDIETMFRFMVECYAESAYYVRVGLLHSAAPRETAIGARLNPASDHWRRKDLF